MKIAAPLLIGRLLSYFTPVPGISKTDAYITATLLSIVAFTQGAIHAPNFFKNHRHGLHLRIAAGSIIYRKVGIVHVHCYLFLYWHLHNRIIYCKYTNLKMILPSQDFLWAPIGTLNIAFVHRCRQLTVYAKL